MEIIRKEFTLLDSTNTWGKQNAETFPLDKMTIVTADEQTSGRGRFNRRWESPPGLNLYTSFCFFIKKHRHDIGNIPQIMAISAAETLEELGFKPELKWPNDVLLSKKKVAGILAETTPALEQLCVVIGIGININMPSEILNKIDRPATSLMVEKGNPFEIKTVQGILEKYFMENLSKFLEGGFISFFKNYKKRLGPTLQKKIRFHDNKLIWEGFFHSINHDGSINLQLEDGEIKTFIVGEILFD